MFVASRVCPHFFREVHLYLEKQMLYVDEEDTEDRSVCGACDLHGIEHKSS